MMRAARKCLAPNQAVALWLAYRLTPAHVMAGCSAKAQAADAGRTGWLMALWQKLTARGRSDPER